MSSEDDGSNSSDKKKKIDGVTSGKKVKKSEVSTTNGDYLDFVFQSESRLDQLIENRCFN